MYEPVFYFDLGSIIGDEKNVEPSEVKINDARYFNSYIFIRSYYTN